jgi:hypothetical protein
MFLTGLLVVNGAGKRMAVLPLIAGTLDAIENTLELVFLSHPQQFPGWLFFAHSVMALVKWLLAFVVLSYLGRAMLVRRRKAVSQA